MKAIIIGKTELKFGLKQMFTFAAAGAFTATWNNRGSETYS